MDLESHPLSLADVTHHDSDFPLDPALDHEGLDGQTGHDDLFLPEEEEEEAVEEVPDIAPEGHQLARGDGRSVSPGTAHREHDDDQTTLDDAAVSAIKASLSQAQAQAQAQAHANVRAMANGHDPKPGQVGHDSTGESSSARQDGTARVGSEKNPRIDPPTHHAPYSREHRDENTPHPEHMQFPARAAFEDWLEGERSWCHLVQRRTTTPEKRAEERIKARIKAHEKMIASMTPEEAANAPPLKRRKRARTSPVLEKITFTCHHAGSYTSKHSTDLPQEKLRLNTKRSVKCNCPARVVLTELEGGTCRIMYYWKHEGHNPFGEGEHDSGRLPRVVDDWLYRQIEDGKDLDDIRAALSLSEEQKAEYIRKALEDPSIVSADMPPPTAFQMKIKYPDIYNRFRKLKGPVRLIKIPKSRLRGTQTARKASSNAVASPSNPAVDSSSIIDPALADATAPQQEQNEYTENAGDPHADDQDSFAHLEALNQLGVLPTDHSGIDHQFGVGEDHEAGQEDHTIGLSGHEMLAHFAQDSGHSELAQALMRLPSAVGVGVGSGLGSGGVGGGAGGGGGNGPADEDAKRLEEEVMKMAKMAEEEDDGKVDEEWGAFAGL